VTEQGSGMAQLPGVDVTVSQPELIARLEERRHAPGYSLIQAMAMSDRVGKEFLRSRFFLADEFLVYFERHDCNKLNRLHVVARHELVAFLNDRIRPERGEGVDLTITTFDMAEFLITNHDGDMWYRHPSAWAPIAK
jgi:hypothetical protein